MARDLLSGTASAPLHSQLRVNAVWGELGLDERAEWAGWRKPSSSSALPAVLPCRVSSSSEVGSPQTATSCLGDGGSGWWVPMGGLDTHSLVCVAVGGLLGPPHRGTAPCSPIPTLILALLCTHVCKPLSVPTEPNSHHHPSAPRGKNEERCGAGGRQ